MPVKLAVAAAAFAAIGSAQIVLPPAITLRPGEQYRFYGQCPEGRKCRFELGAGHDDTSSIAPDGLYAAPASAAPRSRLGGCPLMPLSSIFNTNISTLPKDPNSAAMISQIVAAAGGTRNLHLSPHGSRVVPVDEQTQKVFLQSYYHNLGTGTWPMGTPPYIRVGSRNAPRALNQVGWRVLDIDNRILEVDLNSCDSFEYYFYGSVEDALENPKISPVTSKPYNLSAYGVSNTMDWENALGKPTGLNGSANASGMWHTALELDVDDFMQSVDRDGVNASAGHMIGFTLPNINIRPYNSKDYRWPAILWAGGYTNGLVPYGTRFRIPQSYIDTFQFATACSAAGSATGIGVINQERCQNALRGLLNTLRDYGVIMMDGTSSVDSGRMHVRSHGRFDPDWFAAAWAFSQSRNRGWGNTLAALEAIDESSLMHDKKSNMVRAAVAKPEVVRYLDVTTTAPVVLDERDVVVYPPTVGALFTQYNVVAGAVPVDLRFHNVWATGFKNNAAIVWSVLSGPGAVDQDGKYSPPPTLAAPATSIVRAAHRSDAERYADIRVVNYPAVGNGLCIRLAASQPGNIKDKLGRTCWSFDDQKVQVNPFATVPEGNLMQVVSKDPAFYNGGVWRSGTTSDQMAQFFLPPGRYKVSALVATPYGNPMGTTAPYPLPPNANSNTIDVNGQQLYGPANLLAVIGAPNTGQTIPVTVDVPASGVTNGAMIYGWRVEGKFGKGQPYLAGLLIESAVKKQRRHRRN